ncbi:hypothetical protein JAAARDRAFT_697367, partial [Jaapia argillacea MUCL 33604]
IRPDGFSLPRQHVLNHYVDAIHNFGSPNGICSSITELKHIRAVKEPWRCSSKNNAIGQMLLTNQRLDKLAAARADFKKRNMFWGSVLGQALQAAGQVVEVEVAEDELDVMDVEGPPESSSVTLTARQEFSRPVEVVVDQLQQPDLPKLIQHFLYDQLYSDENLPSSDVPLADCPSFAGRVKIFHSARATFHAPNELSGLGGMHGEIIWSNPSWRNKYERYDTVLIDCDADQDRMQGMLVGRVMTFLSFTHEDISYPCALIEWFMPEGDSPNDVTGMWVVKPEVDNGRQTIGLVHTDCIVRAIHLLPDFRDCRIPPDFHFSYSLDAFTAFYVNKYADYHSHSLIT